MVTQACSVCDFPGDGNCSVCHGKGKVPGAEIPGAFYEFRHESSCSCSVCGGTGECQSCGGTGEFDVGGEG
jgi:hypothetical protein